MAGKVLEKLLLEDGEAASSAFRAGTQAGSKAGAGASSGARAGSHWSSEQFWKDRQKWQQEWEAKWREATNTAYKNARKASKRGFGNIRSTASSIPTPKKTSWIWPALELGLTGAIIGSIILEENQRRNRRTSQAQQKEKAASLSFIIGYNEVRNRMEKVAMEIGARSKGCLPEELLPTDGSLLKKLRRQRMQKRL